jgi:hypothetical protein
MSITPASAAADINTVASELRTGGMTPQREAQLEQQLVGEISGANASANWGMIAVLTDDIADPTVSTSAVNVDVAALQRMVVPTTGSTLSTAISTLTDQLRAQDPLPAGETTLTATALSGATAVTLPTTTGMFNGDAVQIKLDDGNTFDDTITTILNNTVNLTKPLPAQASLGNDFVDTDLQQRDAASSDGGSAKNIVTNLTGGAGAGATVISVKSATDMNDGDPVQIQLSDGSVFNTTIAPGTVSTTLSLAGATNASTLSLASVAGLGAGEAVQIHLDNGSTFNTTITDVSSSAGTVTLANQLPSSAALGQSFTATTPPITGDTTLTSDGVENSQSVTVGNTVGMANGDAVQITLDNGSTFNTIIASISGSTVNLAAPLPSAASTGASFIDPTDVSVSLATALPADALAGGTLTDSVNVPASTNTISFSTTMPTGAPADTSTLSLASVAGMAAGDSVQIALANGAVFNTTLTNVDSIANTVTIATPLPSGAASGDTVTDNISTAVSSSFTATVSVSPQVQAMLQLQLNVLINAANTQADATTLQTIESNLISSSLTTAQFQQDVTQLIDTATQGLTPGSNLTFDA